MKPISLEKNKDLPMLPSPPMGFGPNFPTLWLDDLQDVEIPEEGEIRFRFSRVSKTEIEDRKGERMSVELKLKSITDICDCEGDDEENNEPEKANKMDADSMMESLMGDLDVEELNNMQDESEDDNPEKY